MGYRQTTLGESVQIAGHGVHSGVPVAISIQPADADTGIVFVRGNLGDGRERIIEATHRQVSASELCTTIGDADGCAIATIEHLLSALRGLGVDNAIVDIDGPEVPIVDGSAAPFVEAIESAGIVEQRRARRYLRILKPVRVDSGRSFAELRPAAAGFTLDVEIDFPSPVIGRQRRVVALDRATYRRDLAPARTFGFMKDVERLWKAGLALGASLDNTVAVGDADVVNPEGLRFKDEFVRHKLLDAVGDLALAGAAIIGSFRSYCGGHKLNVMALQALFADRAAYAFVEAAAPARAGSRAEIALGAPAPAFAPERS